MSTLFWIGIVVHVFLCLFLMLLILMQNDKMGGLAGLGGMTSQSAFSTAGAATFIQKLTRGVCVVFFIVIMGLTYVASRDTQQQETSQLKASAEQSATKATVPQLPTAAPAAPAATPAAPAQNSGESPLTAPAQ